MFFRENLTTSNDEMMAGRALMEPRTDLMFAIKFNFLRCWRPTKTLRLVSEDSTCWSAVDVTVKVGSLSYFCKTRWLLLCCDVEVRAPPLSEDCNPILPGTGPPHHHHQQDR